MLRYGHSFKKHIHLIELNSVRYLVILATRGKIDQAPKKIICINVSITIILIKNLFIHILLISVPIYICLRSINWLHSLCADVRIINISIYSNITPREASWEVTQGE